MPSYRWGTNSSLLILSSLGALGVAFITFRRFRTPDALYLTLVQITCGLWAACYAFELAATTVHLKTIWSVIEYPFLSAAPPLFALFAAAHTHQDHKVSPGAIAGVMAIPTLATLAALTNRWHRLLWPVITIDPATNLALYAHGPLFWCLIAAVYGSFAVGIVLLARHLTRAAHIYRTQVAAMIGAIVLPLLANVLYVSGIGPPPGMDWTPVSFVSTSALLAWAIFRLRMFALVPVARHQLVESMDDAVCVLDEQARLVEMNPAARRLVGQSALTRVGRPMAEALPGIETAMAHEHKEMLVTLQTDQGQREYDVRRTSFCDRGGQSLGHLLVLRDVTERMTLERQREALVAELSEALAQVKMLGKMLPICARCKKVRDDTGYWRSVEAYVMEHSDAVFTHGICPECRDRLYPGLFDDQAR